MNFIYEPNIGRGHEHFSNGILGRILEGWSMNGMIKRRRDTRYEIFAYLDSNHTGPWTRGRIWAGARNPRGLTKHSRDQMG